MKIFGVVLLVLLSTASCLEAPLTIANDSVPEAVVGKPYSLQLVATGGRSPYTWSVVDGQLPIGLMLSPSGLISGTPDAAGSPTGFCVIQLADSAGHKVAVRLERK